MKLLRLDLRAFGPFTAQSLEFADGSGLHIVHGRNEAGKSSSLRALRNLLYGIPGPTRCDDTFLHSHRNLRIGGVFEAADGTRLEVIRRPGRAKSLRGPDDSAVFDEARLAALLGSVDETTFQQRFGIDYEELRRGGQEVVGGGGDLKEILFAAGAGLADLRAIQQTLDEESSGLFKPKGSTQTITQALAELKAARKAIGEAQLSATDWEETDEALRQAEQRRKEMDEALARQQVECSRLSRINDSLQPIVRLKTVRDGLTGIGAAPLLPDTFPADRREAETQLETARRDAQVARETITRLDEQLRNIDVPTVLLEHRTAIHQLHTDLGIYRQAAEDQPRRVAERDAAQKSAGELLEQLGRPLPLEQLEALRLPKRERMRIQDLAGEYKALIDRQRTSHAALARIEAELQKVEAQLEKLPEPREGADLERTIRRMQKLGDLDGQLQDLQESLQSREEGARVQLARLTLFSGTLAELERLPVPPVETIERFENELTDARSEQRRCQEKIEECSQAVRQFQEKLDTLRLKGEVPGESDLDDVRRRRDAGWELVQRALQQDAANDATATAAFIDEFAAGTDIATAFRASLDAADSMADRLRREAGRVAEKAGLTAGLQQEQSNSTQARDRLQSAAERHRQIQQQWEAQWAASGISPQTPREMRSWRTQYQTLIETAEELRRCQAKVDTLRAQIAGHQAELNVALGALDLAQQADEEPFSATLERSVQVAEQIRRQTQQRQQLADAQTRLSEEHPVTKAQAELAGSDLDEWRRQWAAAIAALCLDADTKPAEANAVIDTTDEVLRWVDDARRLDQRIDEMRQSSVTFEQSVRRVVEQVAPDLLEQLDVSVPQTVANLVDRLGRAAEDQTKVDGWQEQLDEQKARLKEVEASVTRWEEAFNRLCEQAGCSSPGELLQAEENSRARRKAESELQSLQQQLCQLAKGANIEEWIATVEQYDPDHLLADLTRGNEAVNKLAAELQQVSEAIGRHANELDRMRSGGGELAARATIREQDLLARIRSGAEEYIRLRLAAVVLSRAMERFRKANEGPVLKRAEEVFRTLTLGSFAGLKPDDDESGQLVGVRADGQVVHTSGMSDGTCDQLYLALRIALLESSLAGREPLPFIVDDILIMFDDARAAAALNVLSQLAAKTQVIFFTHHAHLVDIARDVLDGELHVHELCTAAQPVLA